MSDYLTTPAQSVHSKVRKALLRAQEDKKCPKGLLKALANTLQLAAQWAGKDTSEPSTEVQVPVTPSVDLQAELERNRAENARLKAEVVTTAKAIAPTVRKASTRIEAR